MTTAAEKKFPFLDNPDACGLGLGERCCAFLIVGPDGFECSRENWSIAVTIRKRLIAGTMNAKRDPQELYPDCQLSIELATKEDRDAT